ncbi:MAG TPA: GGDEF domain-containing protein [Xanthobacteraceae bacterium]|nr:GGDEF domain-containing protein [Xanthobacteraceae bacterium]
MLLDIPTLVIVSIFVLAILGLLLLLAWVQDRSIQALAWWGAAYLIAGLSIALLSGQIPINQAVSNDIASALLFAACGLSWSGARLFDGKEIRPFSMFAGALIWLLACLIPDFAHSAMGRMVVSSVIVSNYTLFTAFELWGGRSERLITRWPAVIVLTLHGLIFPAQIPLTMLQPAGRGLVSTSWLAILALETLLYMIASAFIVLAMAKERNEKIHKTAATVDPLTGIANRRAVVTNGANLIRRIARPGRPVAALMFDLDHFKKINDRFGHATGDSALIVFAQTLTANLRSTDVLGRLGGEEFAAVLPNMNADEALAAADRVRRAFVEAAKTIDGHPVLGTLSAGVAVTTDSTMSVDALLSRADEALYTAKASGRNRVVVAGEKFAPPPSATEAAAAPKTPVLTLVSGGPASHEAA